MSTNLWIHSANTFFPLINMYKTILVGVYRGGHPPPPPLPSWDDLRLSNTTGILQNMEICMICILSSSHHIIRDLKQRRRRRQQQQHKKNNWFYEQNNCSTRALRFLVNFFDVHCTTTTWKPPNATFCWGRGHTTTHFPFSIWTWINPLRIQLHWRKVAYIWIVERLQIDAIKFERTQIHFFSDVFTAVVVVVA